MFGAITSKNKTLKCQSKDWLPHHCTQTFYFGIIDLDQCETGSRTDYTPVLHSENGSMTTAKKEK